MFPNIGKRYQKVPRISGLIVSKAGISEFPGTNFQVNHVKFWGCTLLKTNTARLSSSNTSYFC